METATLTSLSLEAFEAAESYLLDHHRVRLYLTGDSRLQRRLERVRGRAARVGAPAIEPSPLVRSYLIGKADRVEVDWMQLIHANGCADFDAARTSVRHLTIEDDCFPQITGGTEYFQRILDAMPHLESLDVSACSFKGTVTVPPNITSLALGRVSENPIVEYARLPLTRLNMIADFCHGDLCFLARVAWPATLTRLRIEHYGHWNTPRDEVYAALPATLTRLTLYLRTVLDMSAIANGLPLLQRLAAHSGKITSPLPFTLTHLSAGTLSIAKGACLERTLCNIPASVTSCDFGRVRGVNPGNEPDLGASLCRLVSRLTVRGAIRVVRQFHRHWTTGGGLPSFEASPLGTAMAARLAHAGLDARHVRWMCNDALPLAGRVHHADVEVCLAYGLTKREDIAFFLNGRMVLYDESATNVVDARCLEWGFASQLSLVPGVDVSALADGALDNIVTLYVARESLETLKVLVSRRPLCALKKLILDATERVNAMAQLVCIHECRHNLPGLERIVVKHRLWWVNFVDANVTRMLAEMKMYSVLGTGDISYRVQPSRWSSDGARDTEGPASA